MLLSQIQTTIAATKLNHRENGESTTVLTSKMRKTNEIQIKCILYNENTPQNKDREWVEGQRKKKKETEINSNMTTAKKDRTNNEVQMIFFC